MPNSLSIVVATLQSERNRLANQLAQLDSAIATLTGKRARAGATPHTRNISAAARARIAAAQRARWAKIRAMKKK